MDQPLAAFRDDDLEADEVLEVLRALDPTGERTAQTVRDTFDQLYDGQRTGRYKWSQLSKTERTHYGSLIEINLQRTFRFEDGDELDFKIAGHDIDCKFSESGAWMIPPISFDKLALVVKARDETSQFSLGVVRATAANRLDKPNWDKKVGLSPVGKKAIRWVFENQSFPPNVLATLSEAQMARILAPKSGQRRLAELLRVVPGRRITSNVVATIAQQKDFMRRLRDGGGARSGLRAEGFLVVGGDYSAHVEIARAFNVELPGRGEAISFRVMPTDANTPDAVLIDGSYWRLAQPGETSETPAPLLPSTKKAKRMT